MTKIKEDIKMIDYLKEKGISYDDLKKMIEESINSALEESEGNVEEPEPEKVEPDKEVPTFTKDDIKTMIQEEVINSLKIKRKVPSKGKVIDQKDLPSRPEVKKNWFEVMI